MRAGIMVAVAASILAGVATTSAFARGSDNGDGWLNDAQKNPRFIEPYADQRPDRYTISNPQHGWVDRQRAAGRTFDGPVDEFQPFGRVEVEPYRRPVEPFGRPVRP